MCQNPAPFTQRNKFNYYTLIDVCKNFNLYFLIFLVKNIKKIAPKMMPLCDAFMGKCDVLSLIFDEKVGQMPWNAFKIALMPSKIRFNACYYYI